jgi:hypothetical protein
MNDMPAKIVESMRRFGFGDTDAIYQPQYDSTRIDGGPFLRQFNCVPCGQFDDGGGKIPKTYEDTNIVNPNQLPFGNSFYATGIGVFFVPNIDRDHQSSRRTEIDDTLYVLGHGYLEFRVANRRYLGLAPLAAIPPPFPMYWARDDAALFKLMTASKADGPGVKTVKPFEMVPIYIQEMQPFYIEIRINNVFKLNHVGKLAVMLDGYLLRRAQ